MKKSITILCLFLISSYLMGQDITEANKLGHIEKSADNNILYIVFNTVITLIFIYTGYNLLKVLYRLYTGKITREKAINRCLYILVIIIVLFAILYFVFRGYNF